MTTDCDMSAVWGTAADDLGIEVGSHHVVGNERFPVHVRHFGGPAGALPIWLDELRPRREAESNGYFISWLNPAVYCKYDRAQFIEMLVDWGYFGDPDQAPAWYKDEVAKAKGCHRDLGTGAS